MIEAYNKEVKSLHERGGAKSVAEVKKMVDTSPIRIGWDEDLYRDAMRGQHTIFKQEAVTVALYRPFTKASYYFDSLFNNRLYLLPSLFPTPQHHNNLIEVTGKGASKPFSALVSDTVVDLEAISKGQCFPRYYYEYVGESQNNNQSSMFAEDEKPDEYGYVCRDAITDWALDAYRQHYGDDQITKDAIFWYIYGLLHSDDYRERFRNNLRRGLPRIPFVKDFWAFSETGQELGYWHLNYETVDPYPLDEVVTKDCERDPSIYDKMRFPGKRGHEDKSQVKVNPTLTLRGIPEEAYEYQVNGKSPVDWIIDRYQVKTDNKSGIQNDPNTYSDDPEYIVNLIKRVVRVSIETRQLIRQLPPMEIENI
jgi:predicted helicase